MTIGLTIWVYGLAVTLGAFHGGMWAALAIGLAVLLYADVSIRGRALVMPSRALCGWGILLFGLMAAELPFSSQPHQSLHVWLNLLSVFVPLTLLSVPRVQAVAFSARWVTVSAVAMAVGAVAVAAELFSGGYVLHHLKRPEASLTEYNRGMAHTVIVAFPILAGLWGAGRRRESMGLMLLLLIPAGLTESHTAKLALMVGIACTTCAFYRPIWVRNGLAVFLVALMGFPFYIQKLFLTHYDAVEHLHDSWRHRVEIWDYLSYRIMERPWLGWGLGSTHTLDFTQPHGAMYQIVVGAAPHAHNLITQIWVETGIVGLVFGVVFMLGLLKRSASLAPALRPFALGGFATALTVSLFGFDFWTDALWSAFGLSTFAFAVLQQQIERGDHAVNA